MDSVQDYRPAQRARGRRLFLSFELVNTFSFTLLAGNLIVLLLLKFNADAVVIGLVQAFPYLSFNFMPMSKQLVPRLGLVKTFGYAWILRYILVLPLLAAPLAVSGGNQGLGIALVVIGYSLFQILRGFGLISNSPLTQALSTGKDRGTFISQKNIMVSLSALLTGLFLSLALGKDAPPERYVFFLALGVLAGFVGSAIILRVPEPPSARFGATSPFFADMRAAFRDKAIVKFIVPFFFFIFVGGMGRGFTIVYAKQVYGLGDNATMVLAVVGGLGAIVMGLLSSLIMDRVGAKPLFIIFSAAFLASLIPLVLIGPIPGVAGWLVLALIFFIGNFGGAGSENASQAYFLGIVGKERQFNTGMLYFIVLGLAGALGSLTGGWLLDRVQPWFGLSVTDGFRWFFLAVLALGLPSLILQFRIERRGAKSVWETLHTLFSLKELRAVSLLRRLDHAKNIYQEERALEKLAASASELAVDELLKRVQSPMYAIRNRTLVALEQLTANSRVREALIQHVRTNQFGTASRAVRILGRKGCVEAIPVIRVAVESSDYLLKSYAISALAELGDQSSRELIEQVLLKSDNTLVVVHCVGALKTLANPQSLGTLLTVLQRRQINQNLYDEIIFGLSGVLGMENWLYSKYSALLNDPELGIAMLLDELDAAGYSIASVEESLRYDDRYGQSSLGNFMVRVHRIVRDALPDAEDRFGQEVSPVLRGLEELGLLSGLATKALLDAWKAPALQDFLPFRFLIAAITVFAVETWVPLGREVSDYAAERLAL